MAADDNGDAGGDGVDGGVGASAIVWLGHGPRIEAIDVRDPARPAVIGRSIWLGGTVAALAVDDGFGVAVTDPADELVTLDLRDPARPTVRGRTTIDGRPDDVVIAGGTAYVRHNVEDVLPDGRLRRRSTIAVVDVRMPTAPTVQIIDLLTDPAIAVVDLRIVGGLLAVTVTRFAAPERPNPSLRLLLYDRSDPIAPTLQATHDDPAWSLLGDGPGNRPGHTVYGCGPTHAGVLALDVTNPTQPVVARRWAMPADDTTCDARSATRLLVDADGLPFLAGNPVVAIGGAEDGGGRRPSQRLPEWPRLAALIGSHMVLASDNSVMVVDTWALVHGGGEAGGETGMAVVGTLPLLGNVSAIALAGDDGSDGTGDGDRLLALLRYDGYGLRTLSLDDPRSPTIVGPSEKIPRSSSHGGLRAVGRFASAWVDDGTRDAAESPSDIFALGNLATPRWFRRIADGGITRVMADGDRGWAIHGGASRRRARNVTLAVTPLDEPTAAHVATFTLGHDLADAVVIGRHFVSLGTPLDQLDDRCEPQTLEDWDLSVPSAPRLEERRDLDLCLEGLPWYRSMALVDDILYVVDGFVSLNEDSVLSVVALPPSGPARVIARTNMPGVATGVVHDGGRLFVTKRCSFEAGRGCVEVIDVRTPHAPHLDGWLVVGPESASVVVHRGRVYVGDDRNAGIWVFEPSSPAPLAIAAPPPLALPWLGRGASVQAVR